MGIFPDLNLYHSRCLADFMRHLMGGITRGNTEKVGLSRSDRKESSHMGPSRQSNRGHLLQTALRMLTYLWKEFFKAQLESAHRPCSFVSYEFRSVTPPEDQDYQKIFIPASYFY